jgi:hypothetical protein
VKRQGKRVGLILKVSFFSPNEVMTS